jgi:DNA-binding LacI/PurR family transcriptional regulator
LESRADTIVTSDVRHAFSELAAYAKEKNYKRLKILSGIPEKTDQKRFEKKIEVLTQSFEEVEITTSRNWLYCINLNEQKMVSDILANNDFNFEDGTDIVYISTSDIVPEFYRYCFDRNIRLGQDIGVFGYASGATFDNLMPVFTYSKINNFEIGRRACAKCIEAIRSGKHLNHVELVQNVLVKGETV